MLMYNRSLGVPIVVLNIFCSIIGGIWLAFLGKWPLIVIGILLTFVSFRLLSLLLMLNLPIASISLYFHERKNPLCYIFGFISQFYTNILIVGTCFLAFFICSSLYISDKDLNYVPYLLWSWGIALGPWQFLASKGPDNEFTIISIYSVSIFYLLFLISHLISPFWEFVIIVSFLVTQLIVFPIFNMYVAKQMMNNN